MFVKISGKDETLGTWELQRLSAKEETITTPIVQSISKLCP